MNFDLSDEQVQIRDTFARFCDERISPHAAEIDEAHAFPRELFGGHDSMLNSIELNYPDGTRVVPRNKDLILGVPKGTLYRQVAGGGGGYGDPKQRDREKVAEEVRNGVISPQAARDLYGLEDDGLKK